MKKTITLLIATVFITITITTNAQTAVLTFIGSSGDAKSQISWSLGEVATQNNPIATSGEHLTNGFQQGEIWVVGVEEKSSVLYDAVVYPNPAESIVNIEISGALDTHYLARVSDMNGKIVIKTKLDSGKGSVNMKGLAAGTYLLTINPEKQASEIKTFNIIKN